MPIRIQLKNPTRLPLFVKKHLPDPRAVPQAFARLTGLRYAWYDFHASAFGEPVERRPRGVEPAVEAVEGLQQATREFVFDAAAGDLPDGGAAFAVADLYFIDE